MPDMNLDKRLDNKGNDARRILVVGAGAAGLAAAISAADCGAKVTVLEHKNEAGIKLSLTGNGRCNYTNTDVSVDKYNYENEAERKFVEEILKQFGYEDCIGFFRKIGIEPEIRHYSYDESGYVYPKGMNAADLRIVMYKAALEKGVKFRFSMADAEVIELVLKSAAHIRASEGNETGAATKASEGNETIEATRVLEGNAVKAAAVALYAGKANQEENAAVGMRNHSKPFDAVIIATGSNAYPVTGSDSSIYPVFKALGIKQKRFLPALCALYSKDPNLKEMKGRRIKSEAQLTIYEDGCEPLLHEKTIRNDTGSGSEFYSNKFGAEADSYEVIKGGCVSTDAGCSIAKGRSKESKESRACRIYSTYSAYGEIQFNEHSISGIPVMQLSRHAAKALSSGKKAVLSISGHDYEIYRTAGFDKAQTCTGGISTEDINPHTMRHKKGLYFCGEIIDTDGECGGYNLHFAWSTGYIAGRAAAGAADIVNSKF